VRFEGITISEAQAEKAQQLVQEAGLSDRVRVQAGDYHYLPFAEKVFDVVFCIQSVSYSDNLQQMFQEVYRVLRPGGTLYIEDVFIPESPLSEQQQQEAEKFYQLTLVPLR
jgi:ubiquinone/menaquinone biosynthesis C-methylase UbiE